MIKIKKYNRHDRKKGEYFEFKFDEKNTDIIIKIPPEPAPPVPILQVNFRKINAGDRVWLNGIITANNNNINTFSEVTLTITRTSPQTGTQVIYSQFFEVDDEDAGKGNDDVTTVPFSHVDVPTTKLNNVRYQVRVTVNNPNFFVQNPLTLTASRINE
ncbi:hypothetical protein ABES80_08790 [Bacillus gobiensis]|uniref:hypothetical protein n=1 Tax=Bacillus gobiensis TaxID=1441095 RepID=UPI003D1E382C